MEVEGKMETNSWPYVGLAWLGFHLKPAIPYDSHCTDLKVGCDAYLGLVPMLYTARPLTIWVRPSLESSRLRELLKGQNSREDTVERATARVERMGSLASYPPPPPPQKETDSHLLN